MRLSVLACWGVVAALVVAVQGKPYAPPVFDIARAYENYHQLWMSEARRNSVAPRSFSQQVARTWPHNRSAVASLASSAPVAEKPAVQTKKAMVDPKTQQSTTTEQQTEQPTTEMVTEMVTEPTTTEQAVQTEATTQKTTQQTTADTQSASKQTPSQVQVKSTKPIARPTTMQNAFDNFFTRWNAERIRNSIPPVATPIPPLSSSYYKQTLMAKEPVANQFVDRPAETREHTPEASVDTLTKAASSAPVPTAAATPTDAVELIKSLAQSNNWNQQGNAPIIILLNQ